LQKSSARLPAINWNCFGAGNSGIGMFTKKTVTTEIQFDKLHRGNEGVTIKFEYR